MDGRWRWPPADVDLFGVRLQELDGRQRLGGEGLIDLDEVDPGDLLDIAVINQADEPTNLHTHGLHVSPLGNSDNPLLDIEPGDSNHYRIQIPANHPQGTTSLLAPALAADQRWRLSAARTAVSSRHSLL